MRLVKWIIFAAIVFFAWKAIQPMLNKGSGSTTSSASTNYCIDRAETAAETWRGGLTRFVNPPYDIAAWSEFRGDVDSRIRSADSECNCATDQCREGREALRELRSLMNDLDSAIRTGGSPGGDLVQRQESIDNRLAAAREMKAN